MRIAVFHNLPSGGAKRALHGFVRYLAASGHAVDAFIPSTADESFLPLTGIANTVEIFPVRSTLRGLIVSTLCHLPPVRCSRADLDWTERGIARAINAGSYGIVFAEQDQFTMSPFILKYLRGPTIYFCQQPSRLGEALEAHLNWQARGHGRGPSWAEALLRRYIAARINRTDARNASFGSHVLVNSYFSREAVLRAYGLNSFVCYLGVDTATFRRVHEPEGDYVLSVGACTWRKGYDFILRALGRVRADIRPRLVVVANAVDHDWKGYLYRLATHHGVTLEVKTLPSDEELVHLYGGARLFAYAPYLEPFGLAVLEAMACGIPVVGVKEGGVRESVIHEETGLLVERDERMFGDAVTELLLDERRRRRMGARGGEVVREFWTVQHAGERLLRHIGRVLGT